MKRTANIVLLGVLMLVQVAVPSSIVMDHEMTLRQGTLFRFKTEPVDPVDAFRGRYVALRMAMNRVPEVDGLRLQDGREGFAVLSVDEQGFAHVDRVLEHPPLSGDYLAVKSFQIGHEIQPVFPLDRYYMTEQAAPRAEALYWNHSQGETRDAFVTVRIRKGKAVIEGLYINGKRVEEILNVNRTERTFR